MFYSLPNFYMVFARLIDYFPVMSMYASKLISPKDIFPDQGRKLARNYGSTHTWKTEKKPALLCVR